MIKNLSTTGAKIDIQADAPIPAKFHLIDIKNRVGYEVEMVRRRERDAGLKILRTISLTEENSSFESRELMRLLAGRMVR